MATAVLAGSSGVALWCRAASWSRGSSSRPGGCETAGCRAGRPEGGCGRGEQHERVQVSGGGELVQVPGHVGLGLHHGIDPRRGQGSDRPARRDPRHHTRPVTVGKGIP
jgi:hypothetical protein